MDGRPVWAADGRARIDQLEAIGLHAPDGPYETLAGLVSDLLGRLPVPGEQAALPGWRFTVETVDRHRTGRVRVERTGPRQQSGGTEAEDRAR